MKLSPVDIATKRNSYEDNSVNDLSFLDYGIVCFSLTLLGLLLTILEFRRMSTRSKKRSI